MLYNNSKSYVKEYWLAQKMLMIYCQVLKRRQTKQNPKTLQDSHYFGTFFSIEKTMYAIIDIKKY